MTGIVIVDELDAHLHADLQHDVLPQLIKMFPRIQFIVTSHSPLFPLGMARAFGDDGFTMLELPAATKITAERFSEFASSFDYFKATKLFELSVAERVGAAARPLVLCEGETDPVYLRTAANLLGYVGLLQEADFDWVGQPTETSSQGGGKDRLAQAIKLLRNNPGLVRAPTVLVFDFDSPKAAEDIDNLHIRTLPENTGNDLCRSGIENLLPRELFGDEFYETVEKRTADIVTIRKLRKKALCESVCEKRRLAADFAAFRPALDMLMIALGFGP